MGKKENAAPRRAFRYVNNAIPLANRVRSCHKNNDSRMYWAFPLFTSTFPPEMNAQETQMIRGYVQALSAVSGRPGREESARVAVIADDGTQYHVLHKGAGVGLLADINANVEVTGCVAFVEADADAEAHHSITVKSYRLTDGFDDPWYDDAVR